MIDEVTITVKAGNGGDGALSFRREKFIPKGGPDGGDGGSGGNIIIRASLDDNTLIKYRFKKNYEAENGVNGMGKKMSGKKGNDLILTVPVGTVVTIKDRQPQIFDLKDEGQIVLLAKGGKGGRGNTHFKSAINRTPQQFERGEQGENYEVLLELKLIADIGIIGLPNVGKSSLITKLTNARPKIADYEFTTLEPILGVMEDGTVLADIPGLIKDASKGKGLGLKFLQHIERTKGLIHVIAPERGELKNPLPYLESAYNIINTELTQYDKLNEVQNSKHNQQVPEGIKKVDIEIKKQVVVLNKSDLISQDQIDEIIKAFKRKKINVIPVSCETGEGLEKLKKAIKRLAKN